MSIQDRDGLVWADGKMIPWREASLHFLNHTLHYGVGVFEGVRSYDLEDRGGCIFRLEDHTRRLLRSAHILQMSVPWDADTLNEAQKQVLRENGLREAYIRPICYCESEKMGLHTDGVSVRVMIGAWEWPSYLDPEAQSRGIKVKTSSFTRHHVNVSMCKAKVTGHYVNSILALQEAQNTGCEEALMLDNEGYVSEGSGENIFMVRNGVLHTPELRSCLDGITRDTIITLARENSMSVVERCITRDELYIADEAFFTGTAAEVVPICSVDDRLIGDGQRGPCTQRLQTLFFDAVHGKGKHPEWLIPIAEK